MLSPATSLVRRPRSWRLAPLVVLVVLFTGCGRKKPRLPVAPAPPVGTTEAGIASWYGHPYHGRRAANGEIYDMEELTAAHRTLPFGTWVSVHNTSNGKTVDVRITDRGPFVRGRIIDLSRAAARAIDMIGPGTAEVRLEIVAAPAEPSDGTLYAVQAGAFQNRDNAERLCQRMRRRYRVARLVRRDGEPPMWRVLVGRESTLHLAAGLAERIRAESGAAFVVRLDEPD
jgi:rare lipoprotein A